MNLIQRILSVANVCLRLLNEYWIDVLRFSIRESAIEVYEFLKLNQFPKLVSSGSVVFFYFFRVVIFYVSPSTCSSIQIQTTLCC
jgi:hypothetical protein